MYLILRKIYTASPQSVYRFFAGKKRRSAAAAFINKYLGSTHEKKLQIGCGGNLLAGWLNTDLFPDNKQIAPLDASKTFPLPGGEFSYIYSEHVFEHLDLKGQINYLTESLRILRQGGKIRIATPDFDVINRLTSKDSPIQRDYLDWNFNQFLKHVPSQLKPDSEVYVINNFMRDWGHQLIHNKSSLKRLLEFTGFTNISFQKVGESSDPVFSKLERHANMITERFNEFETIIIEAEKKN